MSNTLALDPDKVSSLEPVESEQHSSRMLAGYALPERIEVQQDESSKVRCLEFGYSMEEVPAGPFTQLDELDNPTVSIELGEVSRKILTLCFDTSVDRTGLARIAARLRAKATKVATPHASQRMNMLLISRILDVAGDEMLRPSIRSTKS